QRLVAGLRALARRLRRRDLLEVDVERVAARAAHAVVGVVGELGARCDGVDRQALRSGRLSDGRAGAEQRRRDDRQQHASHFDPSSRTTRRSALFEDGVATTSPDAPRYLPVPPETPSVNRLPLNTTWPVERRTPPLSSKYESQVARLTKPK